MREIIDGRETDRQRVRERDREGEGEGEGESREIRGTTGKQGKSGST